MHDIPWFSALWFSPATWAQFQFAHPWVLWGLLAIPLVFFLRNWFGRKHPPRLNVALRRSGVRGETTTFRRTAVQWLLRIGRSLLPGCVALALGCALVALARPQVVQSRRVEESAGIDIMLALDVSESMRESDLPPNRLAAARQVAKTFVAARRHDRIGLVAFAGEAFSICPITTDHRILNQYIDDLRFGMIRTSGTAIGDALARCLNRLRDSPSPSKVVILLSDGDNTAGNLDPLTAARLAQRFGIRLFTVAVGKPSAGEVDEGTLRSIADVGRGAFFRATDAGQLRQVFARIDRLAKSPVRVRIEENARDFYRPYLHWTITFLLLALFLKNTVFGNVLED